MVFPHPPQRTFRASGWTAPVPGLLRGRASRMAWTSSKVRRSMIGSWVLGVTIHWSRGSQIILSDL